MNTVKSFWVGMGALCAAGGGTYYFAKKSINADRMERFEREQKRRQTQESLEHSASARNTSAPKADHAGSPSQEASLDPAPTRHAPETEGQRVAEKSKYEAAVPFRARKGDRFS